MQLKWTDLADADLEKIEAYITKQNSPQVAIDVIISIIDSVQLILPLHSKAGRHGRLKHTRELIIDGIPFIVDYRKQLDARVIQILRILHDAQHWPTAT